MKKLDIEQAEPIREKFAPDWEIRKGKYLYKKVAFDDYNQALRFFMVIEKPQIKLDHFADIGFFYNEVILMVYTHDVSGLTQLDFELALYIDDALRQMGARQLEEGRLKSKAYKKSLRAAKLSGRKSKRKLTTKFSENFADGKKKGKSRPGRVKKSGASCNGSVTSLRKKAAKYSGERGRMYHWCANMKSGRKKK